MKRLILVTALLLTLFTGCVKETPWPLAEGLPNTLVVDAILTDQVKQQTITLSRPVATLNQPPVMVRGASVIVSNEDSAWQLREDSLHPGHYLTAPWFHATAGKSYTLTIALNDTVYSAKAVMEPGSLFNELRYLRDEDKGLFYLDWVANAFSTTEAAMWEVVIDWSAVPGYEQEDSLSTHARLLFYTLPTLDVSEIFSPVMETTWFPAGAIITERRYALTTQHASFIREMLLETNWTGGLFPVAPANVTTNLSNGAFGFFGLCGVTELSLVVE